MRKQQIISCVIFFVCVYFFTLQPKLYAQTSKVDSIFLLLQQSNQQQTLDTAKFNKAINLLTTSDLSSQELQRLESEILQFKDKQKVYGDFVKFTVLVSNKLKDYQKSIDYGKSLVKEWLKSNDPDLSLLSKSALTQMRLLYRNSGNVLEGVKYYIEMLQQFKQVNDTRGIETCYYVLGGFYRYMGLLNQAVFSIKRSLTYIDSTDKKPVYFKHIQISVSGGKARWFNNNSVIANYYFYNGDYERAVQHARYNFLNGDYKQLSQKGRYDFLNGFGTALSYQPIKVLGLVKVFNRDFDSAFYYLDRINTSTIGINGRADIYQVMSFYYLKSGDIRRSESYMDSLYALCEKEKVPVDANTGVIHPDYYLALIRIEQKKYAEAIRLLEKDNVRLIKSRRELLSNYLLLADLYAKVNNNALSRDYYQKYIELQKVIQKDQQVFEETGFEMEMQLAKNEDTINQLEITNKVNAATRNYVVAFAMVLLLLIGMVYFRYRSKQKANQVLEKTIQELKTTQQQLVQSEKMASLGELTAGIAHEIQNPLNFVNNFSEINMELIQELNAEINKGNTQEALGIAKDILENESKINHHGKRADNIVKSMLQHSRSSSGQKERTDINALCDEYLRLAYHGLRAKDKSFNANFEMKADANLPSLMLVQQDIGRVILNLISNAFYAVNERKKHVVNEYTPSVTVITRLEQNRVLIVVEDNGLGIPLSVQQKIFQPFFTTKPAGEGTGLGLSLSYDIIKAHGGTIDMESKEGEGTRFFIYLPTS